MRFVDYLFGVPYQLPQGSLRIHYAGDAPMEPYQPRVLPSRTVQTQSMESAIIDAVQNGAKTTLEIAAAADCSKSRAGALLGDLYRRGIVDRKRGEVCFIYSMRAETK